MIMKLRNAIGCLFVVGLCTACSSDSDTPLNESVPLIVNGTVEGATTRVTYGTGGGNFDADDRIWVVQLSTGNPLEYYYKDDSFLPYSGNDFYISQEDTYCAFSNMQYSSDDKGIQPEISTDNQIKWDTSTQNEHSDILWAAPQSVTPLQPEASFRFQHVMSKLLFNVPEGTTSCTIKGLKYISGSFDLSRGEFAQTDEADANTAYSLYMVSGSNQASGCYIPQKVDDLEVEICCDNVKYSGKVSLNTDLKSGFVYTSNLSLVYPQLQASEITISAYEEGGNLSGSFAPALGDTDMSNVQLYDIVLSDGTFYHIGNGMGGIDDTKLATFTSLDIKIEARGIVFWLDKEGSLRAQDTALNSNCTHGLIVALRDVKGDTEDEAIEWGGLAFNYANGKNVWADYIKAIPTLDDTDTEMLNTMQGYSNTSSWISSYGSQYYVRPYNYAWNYSAGISVGTSHWYLPSLKELVYLCAGDKGTIDFSTAYGTANKEKLNSILSGLSTAYVSATPMSGSSYWATPICPLPDLSGNDIYGALLSTKVWIVSFEEGRVQDTSFTTTGNLLFSPSTHFARAICAF
jgi:hypothetical protein